MALIIGSDEVGRGCLAGSVVAAAVMVDESWTLAGLTDSKKLSHLQRVKLLESIKSQLTSDSYSISFIEAEEIDRINILQASLKAMSVCISALPVCTKVLVDGNKKPTLANYAFSQVEAIVKGDLKIQAISAASIIAKVARDQYMDEMALVYPEYGFEVHKGYGTKLHYEMLKKYGPCPIHRRSFNLKLA